MSASYEHHGGFIATTAGFPGVYPIQAVVSGSQRRERAANEGELAKASSELDSGFGNGICNAGVSNAKEDAMANQTFDPTNQPDEYCLDFLFVPESMEDRMRRSRSQTKASLIRELQPDINDNLTGEPGLPMYVQNYGGREEEYTNISGDTFLDQMFVSISQEDKVRVSARQPMESLFKELLGAALVYNGPIACEEERKDVPSKPATGTPDATVPVQRSPRSGCDRAEEAQEVRTCLEIATPKDCVQGPNQTQAAVSGGQDGLEGSDEPVSVPVSQEWTEESLKTPKRTKRKRSSQRMDEAAAAEGQLARSQKRRRTRVEDMNPADVHVCEYDGCGKKFARAYNLEIHRRGHRNEYPFRCDEPNCLKRFMWRSGMERHELVHKRRARGS
ncbi:zinc finger protein [Gracilaria domingensis]|nr:zinc finger protein [Gracilaria domingensis]